MGAWFRDHHNDVLENARFGLNEQRHAMAWLDLHPAEEELEISVPSTGVVSVSARTSGGGPGYHAFLCHALREAGEELGIAWEQIEEEDETDYFRTGDRGHLEAEMLRWLQAVCRQVLELQGEEYTGLQLSLPAAVIYAHDGAVATVLGPRDQGWLERVAAEPRAGIEHFPWWNEARDAQFYLSRALCRMWTAVRWREPAQDGEYEVLLSVNDDLERAYGLDPSLAYPWREWLELLPHLARESELLDVIAARAAEAAGPRVGYRRRDVQIQFPGSGWSIEVPGSFAEAFQEDGRWSAWEGGRTVWVSTFAFQDKSGGRPSAEEALEVSSAGWPRPYTEWEDGPVKGRARLTRTAEDGKTLNRLEALSAIDGGLAACNVFFESPEDRDWAVRIWQTLTHPGE